MINNILGKNWSSVPSTIGTSIGISLGVNHFQALEKSVTNFNLPFIKRKKQQKNVTKELPVLKQMAIDI